MITKEILLRVLNRKPPSIKTKKECYVLLNSGFFGNKVRTWKTYIELLKSDYNGLISIRSEIVMNRGKVKYHVKFEEVPKIIERLRKMGISEKDLVFNEAAPDHKLIFQGEIMRGEKGLYILYSDVKAPMNIALNKKEFSVFGLKAENMIKKYFYESSYEHIMELLEMFPNDVIEFSCYDCCVGEISGRNVIVWEVRGY